MSPYVRTVKTASGATAVQIVHSNRRGAKDIEHIGSAHDDAELESLKLVARERLAAGQEAFDLGLGGVVPYLQGVKELTRIDDIRLEAGQGEEALSLVLGSWLTPTFYVSYGKNLLNESGSFNTRYLLGKGFSIKTETGPSQSGGDIKYEFEH